MKEKFNKSLSMLSWAYNEEKNIATFIERAMSLLENLTGDYELILIDDASTDKTYQIAGSYVERYPQLRIIRNAFNMDCGLNSRIAIKNARKDILFWTTVDWSYDLTNIRQYLEYLKKYDVVQGVKVNRLNIGVKNTLQRIINCFKYLRKYRSDNPFKAFVSIVNYFLIRFLFRLPTSDYQNVTFYPTKLIQSVELEGKSSFVNPECLLKVYWMGKSIKEVPIGFLPREKGTSKGTRFKALRAAVWDIFRLWFKWIILRKYKNRLKGKVFSWENN